MSEGVENIGRNKMAVDEAMCRARSVDDASATSGHMVKLEADTCIRNIVEHLEKKRKTRRRKTKRKTPYNKTMEGRDHNDLQDFDVKLMAVSAANRADNTNGTETQRTGRVRDASFTSAESDQEFYSSPEDEEEFLTKEFSNTYQDLHVESLAAMSKSDLIQTVLQLEEKIDSLEKRLGSRNIAENVSEGQTTNEKYCQSQLCKLLRENEELIRENEKLRNAKRKTTAESSEDSESDSSSSSDSDDIRDSEPEVDMKYQHMNGDIDSETDMKMESDNVT